MFPPATLDKVLISGYYGGSSNAILDRLIVQECETILKEHPYVTEISSMITGGSYQIKGDITQSHKKEQVISDIENALKGLEGDLPDDFTLPTVKAIEQFFPLLSISIFADKEYKEETILAAKALKEKIKKLNHVYQSELVGKFDKVLQISIDNQKLMAYGINRAEVFSQISSLYSLFPVGDIISDNERYFIATNSTNISLEEILDYQIKANDRVIFLRDIAELKYKYEKHALRTKTDGKESLIINVKKAKLGDSIKLSQQIRTLIEHSQAEHPNITIKVLNDSSFWIKTRLNIISSNIVIGLILLFVSIWLLISLKIALVVIVGIPVSLAFGIIGLEVFEGSLNTLSMIGVLLSLGLLVDEAVVVSENIHRHQLMGKERYQACLDGVKEVMPVLFASMLTTIIAFLPLTTLSGGLGLFVKIIPLMVIILIISSFVESFVFLPLHYLSVERWLHERPVALRERIWESLEYGYQKLLHFLLAHKRWALSLFVVLTLLFTALLAKASKFQLFPEFDAMSINITGKVQYNDTQFTAKQTETIESLLLEHLDKNNVASIHTTIGMKTDGRGSHEKAKNLFTITLNLHPKEADDFFNRVINPLFKLFGDERVRPTRTLTAKEIRKKVEQLFASTPKMEAFSNITLTIPQTGATQSDIVILISDEDDKRIYETLQKLKNKMRTIEGVYNIKDDMKYDNIDMQITINSYGKQLGFTQKSLIEMLRNYVKRDRVAKIINTENEFIELKNGFYGVDNLQHLQSLYLDIPNSTQQVRLNDIAIIELIKKATTIKKDNLQKVYTLQASLDKKRTTSDEFYIHINPLLDKFKANGIDIYLKGEKRQVDQMQSDVIKSVIFALFGILLVLTWVFKSIRLSLYALTPIVLSLPGVFIGHLILGLNMTLSSILGLVGLIGIIVNDTALMLGFLQLAKDTEELITQATYRLKPILITSITTMLGFSTLIFFASGESILMQPLAVSIGFGLLWATVVNLFYLPLGFAFCMKN